MFDLGAVCMRLPFPQVYCFIRVGLTLRRQTDDSALTIALKRRRADEITSDPEQIAHCANRGCGNKAGGRSQINRISHLLTLTCDNIAGYSFLLG